jgi:CRISPR-associated endonuclease/helicase Cas3
VIVLAISESHGESARRAAAVLDGYLPRIGRRTWCGSVSAEGLGDLRKALRSKATKATAVAIHRMLGNRRANLLCVVGNSSAFGPDGEAPVFVTRRRRQSADRTLVDELLASAILLAADFHDLGKLTAGFQGHLSDSVCGRLPVGQPLRHEFVSVAVLRNAIDKSGAKSDAAFLDAIANTTAAAALFETAFANLDGILKLSKFYEGIKGVVCSFLPDPANGFPFMRVVADLILSHHRLPEGNYKAPLPPLPGKKTAGGAGSPDIMDTRHVNRTPGKDKAPVSAFLVPASACHKALRNPLWSGAVARDARRALCVLPDGNHLSWRSLFSGAAFSIGRLALMLGDHQGSAIKVADTSADPSFAMSAACYANTATVASPRRRTGSWTGLIDDEGGFSALDDTVTGRFLADIWPVHVHKVRRRAIAAFAHLRSGDGWPCVFPVDLPPRLTYREVDDSPFAWQGRAAAALASRQGEGGVLCPTLGFLLASTGTGKTVAIPRMCAAIAGDRGMRLNVCLGLRSLTLQTGEEYLNRVGFRSDQAIVVIGSRTALRLHEMEQAQDGPGVVVIPSSFIALPLQDSRMSDDSTDGMGVGTSAIVERAADMLVGGVEDSMLGPLAERTAASDANPSARRRLLCTPVLVCTLDTLMSAADARGGGHLGDALRLSSADLVIDEIDSFEAEDIVAIARLVRLAACFGRNVIVSSATLRHAHAAAIRAAFAAGLREFSALSGHPRRFDICWASEHLVHIVSDGGGDSADASREFSDHHYAVATRMGDALQLTAVRRRACAIPIVALDSPQRHTEAAFSASLDLHADNHVLDPETGIRVSIGFVRWNRVKSARAFAKHAATASAPAGMAIAFACYHAKFALGVRHAVYRHIACMLTRKHDGEQDPLLSNPYVRHHLRRAAAQGCTDLVCFLSTTNILEAGCDLDGDWGVTEPCSERSVIQFAGRLRRHRPWEHLAINLGILQSPVPRDGREEQRLARPGVETPVVMPPRGAGEVFSPLGVKIEASGIFPMDRWSARVDATSCLLDLPSPCADAEVALLEAVCLGEKNAICRLRPTSGKGHSSISASESHTVAALSVTAFASNPSWLWTDLFPKWRRFRRQDPKREDVEIRLEGGRLWMRDDASRRRAATTLDDRSAASSWYEPHPDRFAIVRPSLCDDTLACERLLLPASAYDVEQAATDIEEKSVVAGMAVEHWMSREIRTTSLSLYKNSGSHVTYDPWLGMDRA